MMGKWSPFYLNFKNILFFDALKRTYKYDIILFLDKHHNFYASRISINRYYELQLDNNYYKFIISYFWDLFKFLTLFYCLFFSLTSKSLIGLKINLNI